MLLTGSIRANEQLLFPGEILIDDHRFTLSYPPRSFDRDTMYEQVNGEAELLKRYGTRMLYHTLYSTGNDGGDEISIELFDLEKPVNTYGLFRLYAGCNNGTKEEWFSGGKVLLGEFTTYARYGQYFLKIDPYSEKGGQSLTKAALRKMFDMLTNTPIPKVTKVLEDIARSPCDVEYHPDDIDYDLNAGPGYRWTASDGNDFFLRIFKNEKMASAFTAGLKKSLSGKIHTGEKMVIWTKGTRLPDMVILKEITGAVTVGK